MRKKIKKLFDLCYIKITSDIFLCSKILLKTNDQIIYLTFKGFKTMKNKTKDDFRLMMYNLFDYWLEKKGIYRNYEICPTYYTWNLCNNYIKSIL
jgi:hypothetical protein